MRLLIGADPEVFLSKDGVIVSAHDLIPGTKKKPHKVKHGAIQVDGVAAEFNIDPAESEEEFVHNIREVLRQLKEFVPGYEIQIIPTANFTKEYFATLPEEAKELGCDPDFDASRDGDQNKPPDNQKTFRTGAGHIHVGFTEGADPRDRDHINKCITLIKHLDVFLGWPSLVWDNDTQRRTLYGKAGAFRPKSYGCEYRTLSNAWLKSEELTRLVYRNTIAAVESLLSGDRISDTEYSSLIYYINTSNPIHAFSSALRQIENKMEWPK